MIKSKGFLILFLLLKDLKTLWIFGLHKFFLRFNILHLAARDNTEFIYPEQINKSKNESLVVKGTQSERHMVCLLDPE